MDSKNVGCVVAPPRPVGQIEDELNSLENVVGNLESALDLLVQELSPVLRPSYPMEGESMKEEVPEVPMADRIRSTRLRAKEVLRVITTTTDRLSI